eukprot:gene4257-biopygen2326
MSKHSDRDDGQGGLVVAEAPHPRRRRMVVVPTFGGLVTAMSRAPRVSIGHRNGPGTEAGADGTGAAAGTGGTRAGNWSGSVAGSTRNRAGQELSLAERLWGETDGVQAGPRRLASSPRHSARASRAGGRAAVPGPPIPMRPGRNGGDRLTRTGNESRRAGTECLRGTGGVAGERPEARAEREWELAHRETPGACPRQGPAPKGRCPRIRFTGPVARYRRIRFTGSAVRDAAAEELAADQPDAPHVAGLTPLTAARLRGHVNLSGPPDILLLGIPYGASGELQKSARRPAGARPAQGRPDRAGLRGSLRSEDTHSTHGWPRTGNHRGGAEVGQFALPVDAQENVRRDAPPETGGSNGTLRQGAGLVGPAEPAALADPVHPLALLRPAQLIELVPLVGYGRTLGPPGVAWDACSLFSAAVIEEGNRHPESAGATSCSRPTSTAPDGRTGPVQAEQSPLLDLKPSQAKQSGPVQAEPSQVRQSGPIQAEPSQGSLRGRAPVSCRGGGRSAGPPRPRPRSARSELPQPGQEAEAPADVADVAADRRLRHLRELRGEGLQAPAADVLHRHHDVRGHDGAPDVRDDVVVAQRAEQLRAPGEADRRVGEDRAAGGEAGGGEVHRARALRVLGHREADALQGDERAVVLHLAEGPAAEDALAALPARPRRRLVDRQGHPPPYGGEDGQGHPSPRAPAPAAGAGAVGDPAERRRVARGAPRVAQAEGGACAGAPRLSMRSGTQSRRRGLAYRK